MQKVVILFLFLLSSCQSAPHLREAASVSTDNGNEFEVVTFPSLDGTQLRGYLFRPQGAGPFPAIVGLHGCGGSFANDDHLNPRELDWGKRLSSEGYLVILPDSFTTRGISEICSLKNAQPLAQTARPLDARGALKWLEARDDVKKDKIALMGWSNGGSTTLWTIDEPSDFQVAIAFYPGCKRSLEKKGWKNTIPLEIIMGELDNWSFPGFCKDLLTKHAGGPSFNLTLYPDSYHDFDSPHMKLQKRTGIASTPDHTAMLGTNEVARSMAIQKVDEILKQYLK